MLGLGIDVFWKTIQLVIFQNENGEGKIVTALHGNT